MVHIKTTKARSPSLKVMAGTGAGIDQSKGLETGGPGPGPDLKESATAAGPSSALEWDPNVPRREAPDSLRRLSEALEGWKSKHDEINKKFLESFEQIGSDLSKIHSDTGDLRRTYDDVRKLETQRRVSRSASHHRNTLNLLPPDQSKKP